MDSGKSLQTKGTRELDLPRPVPLRRAHDLAELEEPSLLDYLHILLKRKWIIASCVVIGTVLVTIATFRTPRLYDAVGRLAIFRENSEALGLKTPDVDTDDIDISVTVDTQARILQSDAIALQVIRQLRLDQNPYFGGTPAKDPAAIPVGNPQIGPERENGLLGAFHGGLKVKPITGTRILEVHYVGPEPKLDAQIVNTLTNVYIEQNFKTRFESTVQTSEWLSNQLTDLQLKVETSEQRLVDYQKQHGIV